jgi:hypothetical protein
MFTRSSPFCFLIYLLLLCDSELNIVARGEEKALANTCKKEEEL